MRTELEQLRKELNDKIDSAIKSLTPKVEFEVGRWYKNTKDGINNIYCFQGLDNDQYGFNLKKEWSTTYGNYNINVYPNTLVPATESEIQEALIKEAGKRGFKLGVTIIDVGDGCEEIIDGTNFRYYLEEDCLTLNSDRVYRKGKWATIVKEEAIKIGGYEMKVRGETAHFGCKSISKAELMLMITFCERNSFQWIQFDKEENVSLDLLKTILEKLK